MEPCRKPPHRMLCMSHTRCWKGFQPCASLPGTQLAALQSLALERAQALELCLLALTQTQNSLWLLLSFWI